jgi:UDP-GlcNAc3NAcA epimerase
MIRIATILGARPQFIKAAVVSRAIARTDGLSEELIHTGQHYDEEMSGVFFEELEIPEPRTNLGIGSASHAVQIARMLEGLEGVLRDLRPDGVLVYGDANSTLAGTLAAAQLRIPVAHVEAGLRSFNRAMPEEINRIAADHLGDLLFPPTESAERRLRAEGLTDRTIVRAGDVMYDALLNALARGGGSRPALLESYGLESGGYLLATIHRAENTDDPVRLGVIAEALSVLAGEGPVVLPLHPRTRAAFDRLMPGGIDNGPICAIRPVGYLDMQALEAGARVIVTDSGGVQKEAFWHGVPCVTVRHETEWTELIAAGWNRLAPPSDAAGLAEAIRAGSRCPEGARPEVFGDGRAGERIVAALLERFAQN